MKPIHAMGLIWMALLFFSAQGCSSNSKVFQKDPSSFRLIGTKGTGPGQFDEPFAIGVDLKGKIYIADFYNHRIQVFDKQGGFIAELGHFGSEPGQFNGPTDLAFSPPGNVIVVDWGNHRLQSISLK